MPPTVVSGLGAFADASSWNGVIERPAYIAGVFEETPGPILAVGHSLEARAAVASAPVRQEA